MEIREMTVEQIEERKAAIAEELNAENADLNALESEVRSLNERLAEIKETAEKEAEEARSVAEGNGNVITRNIVEEETPKMEERNYGIDSVEFRNAWLKNLQGKPLNEVEERAYATTDSHTAIPTMVSDKFFEKLKKLAPMLNEITLLQVPGAVKFASEGTRNAAAKHTENAAVTAAADTILSVTLGTNEFIKIIQISKAAKAMNIDAFENWLVEMLSGDIARQIDDFIINDSTNGLVKAATWTTGTNQILQTATTGYGYKDVIDLIALLPAAYDAEAKFLMNKKTLYGQIANVVTSTGKPIFVQDTRDGISGKLMGYDVLVDDYVSTSDNAIYLGRYTDIVGNLQPEGIAVEASEEAGFTSASIMYRGLAMFDSKPAKADAFVRLVATV